MGIIVLIFLQESNMKNLCVFFLLGCALAQVTFGLADDESYLSSLAEDEQLLAEMDHQDERLQKRGWFHLKKVSHAFTWHPAGDPEFSSFPAGSFLAKHRGIVKKVCKYGERVCNYLVAYNIQYPVVKTGCHSVQYVCEDPGVKRVAKVLVDAICTAAIHMCQYKDKIHSSRAKMVVKGICWIVKKGCHFFEKKLG